MKSHRKASLLFFVLASLACKSSSPPPLAPIPELPVAAPSPANPSTSPRSAIAAVPRPDLVVPSMVKGARANAQPAITIGGPGTALQSKSRTPHAALDGGRQDLVLKLVLKDGEYSDDTNGRTMTVHLRNGHLISETKSTGRLGGRPPVRREGDLSSDEFEKIASVIETQRLAESESNVTETKQPGHYIDATLDIEWRGKKSSIRVAGTTRLLGSETKTEFAEHPLSKRVAVLLTTLRRIIAGY